MELIVSVSASPSQEIIVKTSSKMEVHGSVCPGNPSSPSLIPPPSESETFHSVQELFSCQFCRPSPSKSPSSFILVGSVSPSSITPFPLRSSSPSSRWSPSVLLLLGSDPWAGSPYEPLYSIPSRIPSESVSGEVGSVSRISPSRESFSPSPSVSLFWGSV